MPRPRTDRFWVERIRSITEDNPKLSGLAIQKQLEKDAARLGRDDWPHDKTIRRIRTEYLELPADEQRQYGRFSWPKSMEDGSLPWEAARAALDLMRHWSQRDRPPIRLVRWFWRVSQVAPDAPFEIRLRLASQMAIWDVAEEREADELEDIGWFLACTPWRSDEDAKAYRRVVERLDLPGAAGSAVSLTVHRDRPALDRNKALAEVELLLGGVSPGVHRLLADMVINDSTLKPDGMKGQEQEANDGD